MLHTLDGALLFPARYINTWPTAQLWGALVSANGLFRLGFFSPEFTNKSYLGIWYNTPKAALYQAEEKSVWVGNRDNPVLTKSGVLTIDGTDGNLKILHKEGNPIVLTSVQGVRNTSATLLDTGNLVLHNHGQDGSILWQSFDYPTNTLLPGMKLGIDLKTGLNRSLTSWRSDWSPASGPFTLRMDVNGRNQLTIRWHGDIYWTTGPWNKSIASFSVMFAQGLYNFSYISNENETYFSYSVTKALTLFQRLTLNSRGNIMGYDNETVISCDYPESLNARPEFGSVQQKLPECRIFTNFFVPHMGFMSGHGLKFSESGNLTLTDCEVKCWNDCSCVAYASKNIDGTGCEYWSSRSGFKESTSDGRRDIYILESKSKFAWIWLIVAIGGALIILLVCTSYVIRRKCKAKGVQKRKQKLLLSELGGNTMVSTTYGRAESHKKDENELHIFNFNSIAAATNNFSTANKVGQGGYGPVYKGKLLDGREIAIKRLSRNSGQGLVEFENEVILISKLQHTNLVRLLGFCIQGEEKILIYEYMPNKSLDFFLFDASKKNILNWKKRFSIIEGITQGLLYLHRYSRLRVIHRDLKASNILLDDQLNPKISDFGMARIFGPNESEANTNRIVGTYGYMSPEYVMNGIVSTKTDVFSFGVLLLEIVSDKKNSSLYQYSQQLLNLIGYAWQLWKEGLGLELIDPTLDEFCPPNELLRCIHLGLLCVQDHAIDRPTMSEIVSMLSNDTISLPVPKQPAFFIDTVVEEPEVPVNDSENCSINQVSTSVMEAR